MAITKQAVFHKSMKKFMLGGKQLTAFSTLSDDSIIQGLTNQNFISDDVTLCQFEYVSCP
jgi:hypothetical protein